MNRLWIRFALIISGILILVVFIPFLIGMRLQPESEFSAELGSVIQSLPADVQLELQARMAETARAAFGRSLIAVGVVGALAGIVISRTLLAPLQDLSDGAQAVAGRDLSYRVPVRGSDEMRTVAESFNHMAEELAQAEGVRRQLLADVAHELRNPLHVLRGNLQAILDGVYPMNQEEMSRLLDQTDHLSRLVNDLHELAQAEARQLPLDRTVVDLGMLVKDTAEVFRPVAVADGIELRVELLGVSPVVNVDAARIRQALQNLLWNALRHTPRGGEIIVAVSRQMGAAEVSVRDSGEGISAEHLPQVFDRFFRGDEVRNQEAGGAGLGLAIVKAIVEAHDGSVRAESAGPGTGSTFTIDLALA